MQFTAKTFQGLEEILANELKNIGAKDIQILKRAVRFKGEKDMVYKANYLLRTALKILWEIESFKVSSNEELYDKVKKIRWEQFLKIDSTFAIDKTVFSKYFQHSHYAALKTKDAIADYFKDKTGYRPVDIKNPDLRVNLYISHNKCTISIDTSEPALFKRGYRVERTAAPLNEVLAAGIILMSDIKNQEILLDPMCGSGTILIEAANILLNIPPGINRQNYGFEKFNDFSPETFEKIKRSSKEKIASNLETKIIGSDVNQYAVSAARKNISEAGLSSVIRVKPENFFKIPPMLEKGVIITNPPYDIRLRANDINEQYKKIGDTLKNKFFGWDAYILSGNLEALGCIGLRASEKKQLFNAKIKTNFVKYNLYKGAKK